MKKQYGAVCGEWTLGERASAQAHFEMYPDQRQAPAQACFGMYPDQKQAPAQTRFGMCSNRGQIPVQARFEMYSIQNPGFHFRVCLLSYLGRRNLVIHPKKPHIIG